MKTTEASLTGIIIQNIRETGPVSFRDFMEMSLYYPRLGYYTAGQDRIGKNGDYYTSPWLSSMFGEMIALQLQEMWKIMGKKEFTVVEFGGGNGSLCIDILGQLKTNRELYKQLHYYIIEKKGNVTGDENNGFPGVLNRYDSMEHISPINNGCILSNELVDNFSVSRVVMLDELMEVYVDYKDGFVETLRPAPPELKDYFLQLGVNLPKGFHTEINFQAIDWIRQVAAILQQGFVMTIDYGYLAPALYSPGRQCGTLVCYHRHRVNDYPYQHIGEQDITAHVNFSALIHWGCSNGLDCCGYTNQSNFLLGLGLAEHLKQKESSMPSSIFPNAKNGALMLRSFLADMGRKFKVLIQNKGVQQPRLSGLRFSQPFFLND